MLALYSESESREYDFVNPVSRNVKSESTERWYKKKKKTNFKVWLESIVRIESWTISLNDKLDFKSGVNNSVFQLSSDLRQDNIIKIKTQA